MRETAPNERDTTSVAFCISTFRRPRGLARLLASIAAQKVPDGVTVRVVVVDNDADGSARSVTDAARPDLPGPLVYAVEPARGIPFARNRSIAEAGDADYLSFVDDDEELEPEWLDRTIAVLEAGHADAVVTRVVPVFEEEPPAWVRRGGFFDRKRFDTGQRVEAWAMDSGAALIRRATFRDDHAGFDTRFLTGSDRLFFTRLERSGGCMLWVDDTVIREHLPRSRSTARWILRRAYRTGNVRSLVTLDVESPRLLRRLRRAGYGVSRVLLGAGRLVVDLPRGRERVVEALRIVADGLGLITGIAGHRFNEYRVIHGR
jgi:glycosyltransferase involved in cell wall biosynthesis